MKIITESGIEIKENEIDIEYAKNMIESMLNIIVNQCNFQEDAQKELARAQRRLDKAVARAALMAVRGIE